MSIDLPDILRLSPLNILANLPPDYILMIAGWLGIDVEHVSSLTQAIIEQVVGVLVVIDTLSSVATDIVRASTTITLEYEQLEYGWTFAIFFVNIIAIFVLIAIALANALRLNIETYAIKKTLPSLLAGFILANLSLLISKALLDVGDLLIHEMNRVFAPENSSIIDTIMTDTIRIDRDTGETTDFLEILIKNFTTNFSGFNIEIAKAMDSKLSELMMIINLLIAAFIYALPSIIVIVLAFIVIIRHVIVHILIVLAPIAIILLFFPPTKSIGEKWLNYYLTWTFILPIIFFILGISTVFSPKFENGGDAFTENIVSYMSGIFMMIVAILAPLSLSSFGQQITSYFMMAPLYGRNPLSAITGLLGGSQSKGGTGGGGAQGQQQNAGQSSALGKQSGFFSKSGLSDQVAIPDEEGQTNVATTLGSPDYQAKLFGQNFENIGKNTESIVDKPATDQQKADQRSMLEAPQEFQRRMKKLQEQFNKGTEDALKSNTTSVPKDINISAAKPAGVGTGEKLDLKGNKLTQAVGVAMDEMTQGIPPQYNLGSYISDNSLVKSLEGAKTMEERNQIVQSIPVEVRNQYDSNIAGANITTGGGVPIQSLNDLVSYRGDVANNASSMAGKIVQNNPKLSADNLKGIMTNVRNGDYQKAIEMASSDDIKQLINQAKTTGDKFETNTTINEVINRLESSQNITTNVQKGVNIAQTINTPSSSSGTPPASTPPPAAPPSYQAPIDLSKVQAT